MCSQQTSKCSNASPSRCHSFRSNSRQWASVHIQSKSAVVVIHHLFLMIKHEQGTILTFSYKPNRLRLISPPFFSDLHSMSPSVPYRNRLFRTRKPPKHFISQAHMNRLFLSVKTHNFLDVRTTHQLSVDAYLALVS